MGFVSLNSYSLHNLQSKLKHRVYFITYNIILFCQEDVILSVFKEFCIGKFYNKILSIEHLIFSRNLNRYFILLKISPILIIQIFSKKKYDIYKNKIVSSIYMYFVNIYIFQFTPSHFIVISVQLDGF